MDGEENRVEDEESRYPDEIVHNEESRHASRTGQELQLNTGDFLIEEHESEIDIEGKVTTAERRIALFKK